jgi:hypothetical protein
LTAAADRHGHQPPDEAEERTRLPRGSLHR